MVLWHLASIDRMYVNLPGNQKAPMARYYKDKIFSDLYFENQAYADAYRARVVYFTRQQMVIDQREREKAVGPDYWRNKSEADLAAFRRMYAESTSPGKI